LISATNHHCLSQDKTQPTCQRLENESLSNSNDSDHTKLPGHCKLKLVLTANPGTGPKYLLLKEEQIDIWERSWTSLAGEEERRHTYIRAAEVG